MVPYLVIVDNSNSTWNIHLLGRTSRYVVYEKDSPGQFVRHCGSATAAVGEEAVFRSSWE